MGWTWTPSFWNMIHVVSPLIDTSHHTIFYKWLEVMASSVTSKEGKSWLQSNEDLFDKTDLVSTMIQFRKHLDKSCPPTAFLRSYYRKEVITRDVWGHVLWSWMHEASNTLEYDSCKTMLNLLLTWIPCDECRKHGQEFVKRHPISNPASLWLMHFHNSVSHRINQASGSKKKIYKTHELQ